MVLMMVVVKLDANTLQELVRRLPGVCCKLGLVKGEESPCTHHSLSSNASRCEFLSRTSSVGNIALRSFR
ncbi:hypothetical protein E2C01_097114 [Portunus trituberculatus]|uniref:Uncharacterized protein n=1 Tax=Portunus trituberculatus TaxID=210409 RepID=A0A5B7K3M9_PORTR|nr:hypothetical protein [Portunus trituberculatus]